MGQCNHEEADTRLVVHVLHALQYSSCVLVHTGDTDVVVILLANFQHMINVNSAANIWISLQARKKSAWFHLTTSPTNLEQLFLCKAIGLFHAFTGCDSTSSFKFKGKRYSYKTFQKLSEVIAEFASESHKLPFSGNSQANCDGIQIRMSFLFERYISRHTNRQH